MECGICNTDCVVASSGKRKASLDIGIEFSKGGVIFQQVGGLLDTACVQHEFQESSPFS